MARDPRATLAFIFGVVGGLLILATAAIFFPYAFGSPYGGPFFFGLVGILVAVVSGVLVITGASMVFALRTRVSSGESS